VTSSDASGPHPDPPKDEAELARLRSEVAQLKAQLPVEVRDRGGWWRPVVAGVLVMLAALLAPLSVLATWAHGQLEDTDRYIATVGPLASNADIQDAIAARVEQIVFSYLDIEAATDELVTAISQQGLSEPAAATLQAAAGPLAAGIENFVSDRIHELIRSDSFEQAWVEANRVAHSQLVAALTGEGDAVQVNKGEVTVGLASIIEAVKGQLIDAGFAIAERIPEVDATFAIVQSDDLAKVQNLLGLLDDLSTWLPVIGLGLLAVAIVIARDRRRMLLASGLAVAASMLLLGAALNAIRPLYLDALPASSSAAAAGALYDQIVSFIRFALRGVLVLALTIAIGAWLSAPRGAGAATRAGLMRGIHAVRRGGARAGVDTGRLGVFLAQYRTAVRIVVLAGAAIWYLSIDHPTGNTALGFVIAAVVLLLVTELLAAGPPADSPSEELAADDGRRR
jgi:hypothetical protein